MARDAGGFERGEIMNDDDSAVARQVDVDLDGIGGLLPAESDSGERVFGGVKRGPAMGDDFHVVGGFALARRGTAMRWGSVAKILLKTS